MCLHVETFSRWSTKYSKWNTQTLVMDRIQLFQVQLTGWPIYNASVIHFWTNQWSVQSKEDCTSAPQSVYPSTRRMSRAFWHDVFRYRTWLLKHKVRSKISQRNLASVTTSIGVLFSRIYGSGNRLTCWQKCIHTVFEFETLKPFFFLYPCEHCLHRAALLFPICIATCPGHIMQSRQQRINGAISNRFDNAVYVDVRDCRRQDITLRNAHFLPIQFWWRWIHSDLYMSMRQEPFYEKR